MSGRINYEMWTRYLPRFGRGAEAIISIKVSIEGNDAARCVPKFGKRERKIEWKLRHVK